MAIQKSTLQNNARLSVCVVAPAMPPVIGGAETFAEVLTLSLLRAGIEIHLLTAELPQSEIIKEIKKTGGSITVLGSDFGVQDGYVAWEWATFSRAEAIHKLVTTRQIDIVHALSHDTIIAASIALGGHSPIERPPMVATTCEMSTEDSDFGIARSVFIYTLPIDGLMQISQYYLNIALKAGCKPKVECIASAVDTELFSKGNAAKGRDLLGIDNNCFLVTCPSRFSRRKGQHDLLAALDLLPTELQNRIVCLLAGSTSSASSEYFYEIKEKAERYSVKCIVTGIPRKNMPDIFAASDLVAMPSYKEGLGLAAIESMVAGCPVLLNKVSGFEEIPNAPGQVLFTEAGNVQELSQNILKLMTNDKQRAALSNAGQHHAKRMFSPVTLSNKTISLYQELLDIKSKPL
ncbi:glycosyltransferase family 4 protein [bacterium]|nr:glycosyltransferase family 4 protein [bacterium]